MTVNKIDAKHIFFNFSYIIQLLLLMHVVKRLEQISLMLDEKKNSRVTVHLFIIQAKRFQVYYNVSTFSKYVFF